MTTVGYGDIIAKNNWERVYTIFSMILGATMFGYIIGSIAALAGSEGKGGVGGGGAGECAKTKRRLDMIRDFCDEQKFSKKRQDAVRHHYKFYYQQKMPEEEW